VAADSSFPIAVPQDGLDTARDVLRHTFGHTDFRGLQAGVIGEILAGRSALAVLPTGGGKSLCYQVPALVRPGLGLVAALQGIPRPIGRACGIRGGSRGPIG
jgi:ATP-dependent DNA helicase RecQ